jgi:sugar phosphate isomerase/epimerase
MKLAVSNIAWAPNDRDAAYERLRSAGIAGLEIAPSLFFSEASDAFAPDEREAYAALRPMRRAGLELVSMQSLLFGVNGAALFEGPDKLEEFQNGIGRAIALAGRFSIPNLVFGAPRQRNIPDDLPRSDAEALALDAFRRLGDLAASVNVRLGMEANPVAYGTNFLNTVGEASTFVERLDHPYVTLILDVGALQMNGELAWVKEVSPHAVDRISHVHISEPDLAPAPADIAQTAQVMSAMADAGYRHWFSIEMKATGNLDVLEASLDRLTTAARISSVGEGKE